MSALDVERLRAWTGRTEEAEDTVSERLVTGFRATLGPHLAPVPEGEAPLAIHWCLAPSPVPEAELGADGHAMRGGFLPPVPLPRRMWAGGAVVTRGSLRIGDRVRRRSVIGDIATKEGRSGRLCFVAVHHAYETDRGVAIEERHDIVYRDAPGGAPTSLPEPQPERAADLAWTVEATPVLLFRYSALTFNGHRIHYDHPYVTEVEGYAGLVVHGPLQASLMLNLAAAAFDRPPSRFHYRGVAPLVAGAPFRVRAARSSDAVAAWTEDAAGRPCMEAQAT